MSVCTWKAAQSWSLRYKKGNTLKPLGSVLEKRGGCGRAEQRTYSSPA